MDLTKMSKQELVKLQKGIARELNKRDRQVKAAARKKIAAIASEAGFSVSELMAEAPAKRKKAAPAKKRAKAPIKFRDPKDAKNTWSGRGRMPRWMAAQVAKGKKKEDFAV